MWRSWAVIPFLALALAGCESDGSVLLSPDDFDYYVPTVAHDPQCSGGWCARHGQCWWGGYFPPTDETLCTAKFDADCAASRDCVEARTMDWSSPPCVVDTRDDYSYRRCISYDMAIGWCNSIIPGSHPENGACVL